MTFASGCNLDRVATIGAVIAAVAVLVVCCCIVEQSEESDAVLVTEPTYTITFAPNGGVDETGKSNSQMYMTTNGQTIYLPMTMFSKDGSILGGWSDGSREYEPGDSYEVTRDVTLTAQWVSIGGTHLEDRDMHLSVGDPVEFTVYDLEDWSGVSGNNTESSHLPDWLHESRDGYYTWDGNALEGVYYFSYERSWYGVSPSTFWFAIYVSSNNPNIDDRYELSFDVNGGTIDKSSEFANKSGPAYTLVTLPSQYSCHRDGYTLVGWAVMVNGIRMETSPVSGQYVIDPLTARVDPGEQIVIEAVWEPGTIGIVYNPTNAPGVELDMGSYGDRVELNDAPGMDIAPEGAIRFGGWFLDGSEDVVLAPGMGYTLTEQHYIGGYWIYSGVTTYTVYLNANMGSAGGSLMVEVNAGDKIFLSDVAFERSGYTLVGFSTTSNGSANVDFGEYEPGSSLTLYAVWRQNTSPVGDISIIGSSMVTVGSTIEITAVTNSSASERGVTFSVVNGTGTISIVSQNPTDEGGYVLIRGDKAGSATLVATANDGSGVRTTKTITIIDGGSVYIHTLIYNANGGSPTPSPETGNSGTSPSHTFTITRTEPEMSGYEFLGWAVEGSTTPEYGWKQGQKTSITVTAETVTLTAIWEELAKVFTLSYDANEGTWINVTGDTDVYTINYAGNAEDTYYDALITNLQPQRAGYTFLGWSNDPNAVEADPLLAAGNEIELTDDETRVLYAVWEEKMSTFTLIFVDGDDEFDRKSDRSPSTYYVMEITDQVPPARDTEDFKGWTDVKGSDVAKWSLDGNTRVPMTVDDVGGTCTIYLYAVWEIKSNTFVLEFDANEGTPGELTQISVTDITSDRYTFEIPTSEEYMPTREHYVFRGWSLDDGEGAKAVYGAAPLKTTIEVGTSHTVLYAVWEEESSEPIEDPVTYRITFDLNGGTDVDGVYTTIEDSVAQSSLGVTFPTGPLEMDGNVFMGWARTDDPLNVTIKPGTTFLRLYSDDPIMDLIAVWQPVGGTTYVVIFDSKGGTTVPNQVVPAGEKVQKPSDPYREGYKFEGWYLYQEPYDFDTPVTQELVLTAMWTETGTDVPSENPVAEISVEVVDEENMVYRFSAVDADGFDVLWDFGDGSVSTAHTVEHTFPGKGPYTVTLTVTADDGTSDTDTIEIGGSSMTQIVIIVAVVMLLVVVVVLVLRR